MSAPRLEVDLEAVAHNTRHLTAALTPKGVRVVGVAKAVTAWAAVADTMWESGAAGLGDSRVENLTALRRGGTRAPLMLIRSPMRSQVDLVVRNVDVSLNTEPTVLVALSDAAVAHGSTHAVVLMVELGDLREGLAVGDVADAARMVMGLPGLTLDGLGTNLACQSGVVPDQAKMDELSSLATRVELVTGVDLNRVSGGNSTGLRWALATDDLARVDELRVGEAILLGVDPLDRTPIDGLRTDAFRVVAEVIEVRTKPSRPWGTLAETAFGVAAEPPRPAGTERRAILAIGRQDIDPDGLTAPPGITLRGASSDHLVVEIGDVAVEVGDEMAFRPDYSALLRAATSPYVARCVSAPPVTRTCSGAAH